MKCSKHYDRDATSQCIDCSKGLCYECTSSYNIPICDQCNLSRLNEDRQLLVKNSIIMGVLFIVGFLMMEDGNFFQRIFAGYMFAGIPWGWSVLNMITPNVFLFLPLVGWFMYFGVKFALSLMIGMFVTPFKIFKTVKGLSNLKGLEETIHSA